MSDRKNSTVKTWVKRGALHCDDGSISISCHHRKSGACGGCFARLYLALKGIEHGGDGRKVATKTFDEMKSEFLRVKPRPARRLEDLP